MFVSHSLAQISQSEAGINYPPFSLDKLLIKNGHTFGLRAVTIPQGAHTMCVCNRLLFYSKCTGFIICFTYDHTSLSMYINQIMLNKQWVTLPVVYCRPFASEEGFSQRFWRILSLTCTVPNNRRTREESLFWKGSSARAIFPQKIVSLRFQTSQQKDWKVRASPHTFQSKIHHNGPELVLKGN